MDHPNEHWRRMYAYFDLKKEELLRLCHRRRDVESKVASGGSAVTPTLALRLARHLGVTMEAVLAGEWIPPGTCPHCGHGPDDFADEEATSP